jgi:nucleoside phosphorylase
MPCAVIITSLPVEYAAVRSHLTNIREVVSSHGTIYEMGQFSADDRTWDIGVVAVSNGNNSSGLEVERSIHYFHPQLVMFVGIARGVGNIKLGDVVVATKVYEFESAKVGSHGFLLPTVAHSSTSLVQRARTEAQKSDWLRWGESIEEPKVVLGAISTGETMWSHWMTGIYHTLHEDVVALEKNSFGWSSVVFSFPETNMILIRGISDLGEKKETKNEHDWQKKAAFHASMFAFVLLAKLDIKDNLLEVKRSELVSIDPEEDEGIDQPFDPAQIRIESKNMTIDLLLKRIQHGELNLSPDFQRIAGIWKPAVQSRLIESLLIRIPLPAFYLDATDDEEWAVIDGLQRLSTLKHFVLDKRMNLEGLEFLHQFKGFSYDELPRDLQRRIEETQVTVYLIGQGTPPEVKFNIFKRINTGGLPLSTQEIRHALNQGQATSLIKRLAETATFVEATGVSSERMVDQELVLRFLAFMITSPNQYRSSDFDSFLNNTMVKINHMDEDEITVLSNQFDYAIQCASKIFGSDAFRKPKPQRKIRNPVNKSLFESWCVNLAQITPDEFKVLEDRKYIIGRGFEVLMENTAFNEAISQGTSSTKKVRKRFEGVKTLIDHCLSNEYEDMAKLEKILSGVDDNSESSIISPVF